jgi:hypothetical protein
VSARHQVNGRIELKAASLPRAGPAEETGFLRSVQIAVRSAISPAAICQSEI